MIYYTGVMISEKAAGKAIAELNNQADALQHPGRDGESSHCITHQRPDLMIMLGCNLFIRFCLYRLVENPLQKK